MTMDDLRYPAYRAPRSWRLGALIIAFPALPLLWQILTDDSWPWPPRVALALPIIATILLLLGIGWRSLTRARPGHLVTRRLLRARKTPWSQIDAIGLDQYQMPVAKLADGRRVNLPNVIDDAHGTRDDKLAQIRDVWRRQRDQGPQ